MNDINSHIPGGASPPATSVRRASIAALRQAANRPEARPSQSATELRMARRTLPRRAARLPELAPAEQPAGVTAKAFTGIDLDTQALCHEETRPSRREESENAVARLTVYVMNAILLVIAFPVGFGMLVFNILGGENIRTTAHVIALTGFAIALTGGALGSDFLYGT